MLTAGVLQRQVLRARNGALGTIGASAQRQLRLGDYMADAWNVESDADTIALAQQLGIPDGTNLSSDFAASEALLYNIPYSQAQGIDPGIASNINNWIQTAAVFSTQLATAYAAAPASNQATLAGAYANTQNNLSNFQTIGQQLQTDTSNTTKLQQWITVGQSIIANANDLANSLGIDAVTFSSFWQNFPQSLTDVLAWTGKKVVDAVKFVVNAAGQVTKQAAWSTAEVVLVVGGSAIAVLWALKRFGGVDAGGIASKFLGFGGIGGIRRKVGRRPRRRRLTSRARAPFPSRGWRSRKLRGRRTFRGRGHARGFLGARTGLWVALLGAGALYFIFKPSATITVPAATGGFAPTAPLAGLA